MFITELPQSIPKQSKKEAKGIEIKYDFHIHSCLSPCADDSMTPDTVVGLCALNGLDVIALTDHNTAINCVAAERAAREYGIGFIPGLEVTTAEEVHIICLFPDTESALAFGAQLYKHLPNIKNKEHIFGNQLICDEDCRVIGKEERLLINAVTLSINQCISLAESFGGFSYPAHIDRQSNGILGILGGIPEECNFKVVEADSAEKILQNELYKPYINMHNIITASDAHYPQNLSMGENTIEANGTDFDSIKRALLNTKNGG